MKKFLLLLTVIMMIMSMVVTFSFIGCKKAEEAVAPAEEEVAEEEAAPAEEAAEEAAPSEEELKTLICAHTQQATNVDPHIYYEGEADIVIDAVYEGLFTYEGPESKIVPVLATGYDVNEDNTEYTIYLRENVTFHDGTPFNADAVLYNYERQKAINEGPAWMLSFVDSVEKIDDYTIKMKMVEPSPNWIHYLSGFWSVFKMISPTAIKEHDVNGDYAKDWLREHAVGTGPYKLDEWIQEQQYVMSRYEDYWKGWENSPNNIGKIVLRIIPETNTQRMLIEKGDIDMILMPLTTEDYQALEGKEGIVVAEFPGELTHTMAMNCAKGPTANKKVRQALSYAFNYDVVLNDVFGGRGIRMQGAIEPGFAGYGEDYPIYSYDMDKAKELLAEAGYPNGGFKLTWTYMPGFTEYAKMGQIFQADLKTLGIDLELSETPLATIFELESDESTSLDFHGGPFCPDNADPYALLSVNFGTEFTHPNGTNWSRYSNPDVDSWLEELKYESDQKKAAELVRKINEQVLEDAVRLFIAQMCDTIVYRDNIKGFEYNPFHLYSFDPYKVWKE